MTAKLEPHEAADAFPMMESGRFEELKADIEEKGLLVPITICEGRILDGRNRYKACRELGIEPSMRTFEGDPWAYVWSMNGQRRDLVREQRYLIWKHCHERSAAWQAERERIAAEANAKRSKAADARRGKGGKLEAKPVVEHCVPQQVDRHKAKRAKAAASKTNVGAVARGDKLDRERPDLAEKVRLGTLRPAEAHKQMRREERERKEKEAAAMAKRATWTVTRDTAIVQCDALVTDPPYGILDQPWEPAELESFTREWAGRWNACGADLAAIFFSQRWLWDARRWFDESLVDYSFQQLLVWHYPNNKSPQSRMGFKQTWEPVFLYRRNESKRQIQLHGGDWGGELNDFDCHVAAVPQSNFNGENAKVHPAQKPVSVMAWLVNAMTSRGERVADPFCGSGTTGIAAVKMGRGFYGIETDGEYVELATQRIAAYGERIQQAPDDTIPVADAA